MKRLALVALAVLVLATCQDAIKPELTTPGVSFAYQGAPVSTFTVNSTDDGDDGTCNAIHCSLREAINAANTSNGFDAIEFNIPGPGPHTIQPVLNLPSITDPVVIDGGGQRFQVGVAPEEALAERAGAALPAIGGPVLAGLLGPDAAEEPAHEKF